MTTLHQQIAEAEGYEWDRAVDLFSEYCFPDGPTLEITERDMTARLIEKYKLEPCWNEDGSVSIFHFLPSKKLSRDKDLTTAVFKAVLALVENKDDLL